MAEQISAILSAGLTPEQLSTVLSAAFILEHVTKVRSGASTAERSQVTNAPASARDKCGAHCVGAAASSPPGKRVGAHGRRRGAPGQNQKDSQASGIRDTRRDHRTAQQNEKSTPDFEGATGRRTRSVTVDHEKGSSKVKLGTHKECDNCCRRGGTSGCHENCAIK
jgi:hypothetical protein